MNGTCDVTNGFCKCPIGRSGRRCQFQYRCSQGSQCYRLIKSLVDYKYCFLQRKVADQVSSAHTSCPTQTHYVSRCFCYPNCLPLSMYDSRFCHCKCKAPETKNVPITFRGKYVTSAVCCPKAKYL